MPSPRSNEEFSNESRRERPACAGGLDLASYAPSIMAFEPDLDDTRDYLTGVGYLLKERLYYTLLFVRGSVLRLE
jgi:hypothetical protein